MARWRRAVRVVAVGAVAIGLATLAACGSGRSTEAETTGTTVVGLAAEALTFHPVLVVCPPHPEAVGSECAVDPAGAPTSLVLPSTDSDPSRASYALGPAVVDGTSLETARAVLSAGNWTIQPVFREGPDGIDRFNEWAAACAARTPDCPTGQLAIVRDGVVVSAPTIQQPSFERDQIQISGDFDEQSAGQLVRELLGGG